MRIKNYSILWMMFFLLSTLCFGQLPFPNWPPYPDGTTQPYPYGTTYYNTYIAAQGGFFTPGQYWGTGWDTTYWPVPGTGTISKILTNNPLGGVTIRLQCGTYIDNLNIASSNNRIVGENYQCVNIIPLVSATPLIQFNASTLSASGMNFNELSDVSLSCTTAVACGDAIKVLGITTADQANDWIKVTRVYIVSTAINSAGTFGFLNGIDITNRTIWSMFDNVWIRGSRNNNVNVVPVSGTMPSGFAATNDVSFTHLASSGAFNYGFFLQSGNTVNPPEGYGIHDSNIEFNGWNTALISCAGVLFNGTSQIEITNTTFESNCVGNVGDATASDVRLTGTFNQAFGINDNTFNQSGAEAGVWNDTTQTIGTIDGNKFNGATVAVHTATTHALSSIQIGSNFTNGESYAFVADGGGLTHVFAPILGTLQPVTLSVKAAAGTGATTPVCAAAGICSPSFGQATFSSGTGTTTGDVFGIAWTQPFPHRVICLFSVLNQTTTTPFANGIYDSGTSTTSQGILFVTSALTVSNIYNVTWNCP